MNSTHAVPVYVSLDRREAGLVLTLQGGPERVAGCVNPSEPIERDELEGHTWRAFALVGSQALAALARALADADDLVPAGVLDLEPTFGFEACAIYDNKLWDPMHWHSIARELGIASDAVSHRVQLCYASLHQWHIMGWPYRETPFELNWEFGSGGRICQRWLESGYDGADLEVHLSPEDRAGPGQERDVLQRLRSWARAFGYNLLEVSTPINYVAFEPYPEPTGD